MATASSLGISLTLTTWSTPICWRRRSPKPLAGEVINVGCGLRISVKQLAIEMARMLGRSDLKPVHQPDALATSSTRSPTSHGRRNCSAFSRSSRSNLVWKKPSRGTGKR